MPDRRILVIDDDTDVLAGLAALLSHTGWDVGTAATGQDGLRKFAELSPDIVLLDVNLPDASGIDLLDQIKAYSEETPIIVMSGLGTIDVAVAAMRKVPKPFSPSRTTSTTSSSFSNRHRRLSRYSASCPLSGVLRATLRPGFGESPPPQESFTT